MQLQRDSRGNIANFCVPAAPQIHDRIIGGLVIVDLDQRQRTVAPDMRVHAYEGDMLLLQKRDEQRIFDLTEDDTVAVLAADGGHQLRAVHIFFHEGEHHAVAQLLARLKYAVQDLQRELVEQIVLVPIQHDVD